jgi:cell division protein FtsN
MSAVPKSAKESRGHPMLLGVLIGLLLGIIIALAVALYLNRLSSPFTEKQRQAAETPKVTKAPEAKPPDGAKKEERPRFEFYNILPGDRDAKTASVPGASASAPPAAPARPAEPVKPMPAKKPEPAPAAPVRPADERVYVQAGAFPNESDADNLKAKIAFMGLEAAVVPVNLPDKGTWYRVRLGPYKSLDDANRAKTTLSQNGVSATTVK